MTSWCPTILAAGRRGLDPFQRTSSVSATSADYHNLLLLTWAFCFLQAAEQIACLHSQSLEHLMAVGCICFERHYWQVCSGLYSNLIHYSYHFRPSSLLLHLHDSFAAPFQGSDGRLG